MCLLVGLFMLLLMLVEVVCCCPAAICSSVDRTDRIGSYQTDVSDGTGFYRRSRLAAEMASVDWKDFSWPSKKAGYHLLAMLTGSDSQGPQCKCDVAHQCWAHAMKWKCVDRETSSVFRCGTDFRSKCDSLCPDLMCNFEHHLEIVWVWGF